MSDTSAAILFFMVAPFAPCCHLQAQVIEGSVTNSSTGLAIPGVTVTIESKGKPVYQTTTDIQGGFRIDGVVPGIYSANFSKTGLLSLDPSAAVRRPFQVVSADHPVNLQAKLTPYGKITGRVLNMDGEAIGGSELLLDSHRMGFSTTADNDGNFSFEAPPGRYTLLAKPPASLKPPPAGPEERLGWVPTYYPGMIDPLAAVRIAVGAGAEMFGYNVKLKAAPMRRLRGVVLDLSGDPAPQVAVRAARTDETVFEDLTVVSADDGSFDFPSLWDGEWSIFAEKPSGAVKLKASGSVEIGEREPDRLVLRLTAPFTLRGGVGFEGEGSLKRKIGVFLRPAAVAGSQGVTQGLADTDGSVRIDNVYPGRYKLVVNAPDPPYFLTAIRMADRDILGQYVELDSGAIPVQIVFGSKGGGFRGQVEDGGTATVVLVPQEKALREAAFVQTVKCAEDGHFEFTNLRPGDYYAFAFTRWAGALELLPSLDLGLLNQAVSVHVNRGETAIAKLGVTPWEE